MVRSLAASHPCIFRGSFIRTDVDPRVQDRWRERFGDPVPFGTLRKVFREKHCAELNPYDSTWCAYTEQQCAIAFYQCVLRATREAETRKEAMGYFANAAAKYAPIRADEKPLARSFGPRDAGPVPGSDSSGPTESQGEEDWQRLRRRLSRPERLGDVLGRVHLGPREGRADDGKASPK